MPTPEEIEEVFRNAPTPEQIAKSFARRAVLSKRYDEAVQQAEHGLRELMDMVRKCEEGMANSAARELVRILNNTLLDLNSPKAAPGKEVIWSGEGPNPQPNWMSDPIWPEAFKRLARKEKCWPVLYYVHPEHQERLTKAAIAGFEVGTETGTNLTGKRFSFKSIANSVVVQLKDFIEKYRGREFRGVTTLFHPRRVSTDGNPEFKELMQSFASLPPLSRAPDVLKAWRKAGNELLPYLFGEELEKSPQLKGLLSGKKTERLDPNAARYAAVWWQRDLIRKAVSKAWRSVAAYE